MDFTPYFLRMSIIKNDREIHQPLAKNGIYVLHPKALVKPPKEEKKLSKISIVNNPTFLWHYKFDHISLAEMKDLNAI